jgi:hypothetical protein
MNQFLELLGFKVRDRVTGFAGVVTSVSFDLYGCVQCVVTPPIDAKGETTDPLWFDEKRLEVVDPTPVLAAPLFDYVIPGPAEKPAMRAAPLP